MSFLSGNRGSENIPASEKGTPNGVATLDANATLPPSQLPAMIDLGAATTDQVLEVGQVGKLVGVTVGGYTTAAAPLRVATGIGQVYEVIYTGLNTGSVGNSYLALFPNGTTYTGITSHWLYAYDTTTQPYLGTAYPYFIIGINCAFDGVARATIAIRDHATQQSSCVSYFSGRDSAYTGVGTVGAYHNLGGVQWTSLGSIGHIINTGSSIADIYVRRIA